MSTSSLTGFMRGDREHMRCTVDEIVREERRAKRLAKYMSPKEVQTRRWMHQRFVQRAVQTIEDNLAHGRYRNPERVRSYLEMCDKYAEALPFRSRVEAQFREAEAWNATHGRLLGSLLRLKRKESTSP